MAEPIRYHVGDRVATVPLYRPGKRNALYDRLVAEVKGALAEAAVQVVGLTGAGKAFSAGAALEALQAATPRQNAAENHPAATGLGRYPYRPLWIPTPRLSTPRIFDAEFCDIRVKRASLPADYISIRRVRHL